MTKQEFFANIDFFEEYEGNGIFDFKISSDKPTLLLYNTNDLWLTELQFDALTKLISPYTNLYVAQNDSEKVYEIKAPLKYEDYERLDLFSVSFIASKKFDWVIVMDEGLESGTGILIGEADFIQAFIQQYRYALKDIYDLIAFHYRDSSRNAHSIDNLIKILSFGHPFIT